MTASTEPTEPTPFDFPAWPATRLEATADAIGRVMAVEAFRRYLDVVALQNTSHERAATPDQDPELAYAMGLFGDQWTGLFMLRRMPPNMADAAAAKLWRALDANADPGHQLVDWLTGYGYDPDKLTAALDAQGAELERLAAGGEPGGQR